MKLNYLIVMPKIANNKEDGYSFPLGILYISAVMKEAGFNVYNLNLNHSDNTVQQDLDFAIKKHRIDIVLTGGLSAQFNAVKMIVDSVHAINKKLTMIVGGGLISSEPNIAMEALEYVDFGVIGEGEITIVELCNYLEKKIDKECKDISGIIFKESKNSKYYITEKRPDIKDLNSLPWPDYEGFEYEKNLEANAGIFSFGNKRIAYIVSSRSCPYKCTFCFHTTGKKYRQRSFDEVFKEIDYLISKYKIDLFMFADELFSVDIERVKIFCSRIKNYNVQWTAGFRVSDVTEELVKVIKSTNNCTMMGFGLESADNSILKSMRKKITVEQIDEALEICYRNGVDISGNFIFGDINETVETANNSLNWLIQNKKYNVKVSHVVTYPGTFIYQYACENNLITDKIKFLKDGCPQINISKMTDEEYSQLHKKLSLLETESLNRINSYNIMSISKEGFISIHGYCNKCSAVNNWEKVKMFKFSYMICKECNNLHLPPVDDKQLIYNLEQNIARLTSNNDKIAIWGMTEHMITVLHKSASLINNKNIFLLDNYIAKQGNTSFGKMVYPPSVIKEFNIEHIIVSAVMHMGVIESQVRVQYPDVKSILDISHMIHSDYVNKLEERTLWPK
jgi:anaerobic magnesium-protoporphyrin IX monomethyl ester cyclase